MTIRIPDLRERAGDLPVLAKAFLSRFAAELAPGVKGFDDSALAAIESHSWPGNVRELESKVKRGVIMAEGTLVTAEDLELPAAGETDNLPLNLRQIRESAEQQAILRALGYSGDNISEAAELLGVTRPTLYNMLEKYRLR